MQRLDALGPITASTDRFVATVASLTDVQVAGDTLVPPWTRGHVITHVARAADSLCRLLTWALTGVETPQYTSMDARAAEIEAGAGRPVAALVADIRHTAARFEDAVRALPPAAWHHEVRMRTGELRTPAALIPTRLRELEIHHADLDVGYSFADIPADAARWIIGDIVEALPGGLRRRRCVWRRPTPASSRLWAPAVPQSGAGRPTSSPGSAVALPERGSPWPAAARSRRRPSGSDRCPGARRPGRAVPRH
ncbi:maleylpyruvate isomerase family mycothiol-dependent enzyme [Streptomyces sp. ATE26]|uniref:maleylpyruvate isomerase family mycothiol-dependent enzyme n=1 Tax=Streptomyces sp. ATE26 TaxID=2954237 RepID=UPI0024827694|nr:maleylpyruvate isomerase family mycothiol-dependent enzyme [Streptomyces sp. ATE26]MDI1458815.1 maleylpyruvate isomerase family mycothiol-dependent enzyme [Streptomyces sp. ATE26]